MPSPVKVIVVGAGSRGQTYSDFASIHPDRMQVVGIADPRPFARRKLQERYKVADEDTFDDWHCVAKREKFADAVFICTPDRLHKDPAVALAKKGYHILLEKPMAVTEEDCTEITETCIQSGVMLVVCHVLRYDPTIRKIKELIDSGAIGDIIHIQHLEPVGFYHFAHSFVRGNWRNEAESSFALLAKSCHDLDLIHHWAGGRRCIKVSSFGSLSHFQRENKPPGAANRCLDCSVESDCPYSAKKIYLDRVKMGFTRWPVSVICSTSIPDIESVTEALKAGPYGRCVYECDNDVCSNQVVNMEFEGGLTASFTMVAFTEELCLRKTSICGSRGELSYNGHELRVFDFLTQTSTKYEVDMNVPGCFSKAGHGVADYHLVDSFISAVASGDPLLIQSGAKETLASHRLVFEAERARLESRVVLCGTNCV
ncbi:1-carboxy-3-chloro-3,4-dihydroxycyclo hexa-1,5-diene dehydrogenase [Electrophorus electricus]|uniref:Gfo/Idh/MocA-like oxidoreductase N-terminal domain-containing protein n=1 Tax=Electrophorus electricus TaxID=8005 RepID=A0A4W4EWN4_ELEEL|nr:1-carboxy-3-chloro-3,4-dihydroxycyclo hexa-1,5-diene dehydrogenase [Electrophorus electricus]XP_026853871.2 1-carboxy-3-chloro-3,4-dihydroxycyclo hexa-1,5-diene dehydrogenase [Electrophorus electricus]XP_035378573.1 1-carboxy-3-chloro-3,4-dihydroxycyclo hexa-1,5-diene dehydrogenase [Electrophorus electricus]